MSVPSGYPDDSLISLRLGQVYGMAVWLQAQPWIKQKCPEEAAALAEAAAKLSAAAGYPW